MSSRWRRALLASALAGSAACSKTPEGTVSASVSGAPVPAASAAAVPTTADPSDAERRARAAAAELGASLRTLLQAQLTASGPAAAVDFCRTEAPRVASEVAARHRVRLGRTALRVRSSTNTPGGWQKAALDTFAAQAATGRAPESLASAEVHEGTLRWARGIRTESVCTLCHGAALPADVTAALQRSYPGDRATGFAEGDLRGLIWVEVPAESGTP